MSYIVILSIIFVLLWLVFLFFIVGDLRDDTIDDQTIKDAHIYNLELTREFTSELIHDLDDYPPAEKMKIINICSGAFYRIVSKKIDEIYTDGS